MILSCQLCSLSHGHVLTFETLEFQTQKKAFVEGEWLWGDLG